jgi:uncharacterized protein
MKLFALLALFSVVSVATGAGAKRKCGFPVLDAGTEKLLWKKRDGNNAIKKLRGIFPKVFKAYMVPMSDGVHLHTNVISPPFSGKTKWPAVIDRSPYGGAKTELLADIFLLFDFIAIGQDMRGTCLSEGNFSVFHTDQKDGNDTINWLVEQEWSDGRVFEIGASADGIASLELAIASPKPLQAQFIIFATGEAEETFFPGGAYRYALIEKWINGTIPDQAPFVLNSIMKHEGPSKSFWGAVELSGGRGVKRKFNRVKWPVVMWAGWYDIFEQGNLETFDGIQHESDPSVRGKHYLVVDPLGHCQSGSSMFPHNLIEGRSILPILLGINLFKGDLPTKVPEGVKAITFYVMGSIDAKEGNGNYWTSVPDWPKRTLSPLYLHGDGSASFDKPTTGLSAPTASSTYTYDPSNPVPTKGGNNLEIKCGPLDQSDTLSRKDVLTFVTSTLDKPVALTGPLAAHLFVSTSKVNDTDFTMKLVDVYPDGRHILVNDGIRRMRWRTSRKTTGPEPIVPGRIYPIEMSLWNTSYVFSPGHKIMVAVSSSNAPRFQPNPNTGLPITLYNKDTYLVTDNTLYHSAEHPSSIDLPIVELSDMPKHNVLETEKTLLREMGMEDSFVRGKMMRMLEKMQGRFNRGDAGREQEQEQDDVATTE